MRSNPTAAWDKSAQAQAHFKAQQATKRANAHKPFMPSKRTAKHDKASLHKAKAWHYAPVALSTILRTTKASRITWI
jgi:hypothetical protein